MTSYPAGGIVPHYTQGTEFYSHDEAKILCEKLTKFLIIFS